MVIRSRQRSLQQFESSLRRARVAPVVPSADASLIIRKCLFSVRRDAISHVSRHSKWCRISYYVQFQFIYLIKRLPLVIGVVWFACTSNWLIGKRALGKKFSARIVALPEIASAGAVDAFPISIHRCFSPRLRDLFSVHENGNKRYGTRMVNKKTAFAHVTAREKRIAPLSADHV